MDTRRYQGLFEAAANSWEIVSPESQRDWVAWYENLFLLPSDDCPSGTHYPSPGVALTVLRPEILFAGPLIKDTLMGHFTMSWSESNKLMAFRIAEALGEGPDRNAVQTVLDSDRRVLLYVFKMLLHKRTYLRMAGWASFAIETRVLTPDEVLYVLGQYFAECSERDVLYVLGEWNQEVPEQLVAVMRSARDGATGKFLIAGLAVRAPVQFLINSAAIAAAVNETVWRTFCNTAINAILSGAVSLTPNEARRLCVLRQLEYHQAFMRVMRQIANSTTSD